MRTKRCGITFLREVVMVNGINGRRAHGRHCATMFWETMNLVTSTLYILSNALTQTIFYSSFCVIWQTHCGSLNLKLFFHVLSFSSESKSKNYITANTKPFVFLEEMPSNIRNIMLPGKQVLLWDPLSAFSCHFLCNKENPEVIWNFHFTCSTSLSDSSVNQTKTKCYS